MLVPQLFYRNGSFLHLLIKIMDFGILALSLFTDGPQVKCGRGRVIPIICWVRHRVCIALVRQSS